MCSPNKDAESGRNAWMRPIYAEFVIREEISSCREAAGVICQLGVTVSSC
jgi:hypothetical protein